LRVARAPDGRGAVRPPASPPARGIPMSAPDSAGPQHGDYYREIYARGLAGERPSLPVAWPELEARAAEKMDARANGYVFGSAGTEDTARENLDSFRRWRIVPRYLRDVARRDLTVTVVGTETPAPVLLAPVGVQTIVHPDGELATARAASALGVPFVVSSAA